MVISMTYYVFQVFFSIVSIYNITYLGEAKTIDFSPHQLVIKDFKYPVVI
jgi:hypothetical protein